jgi:hypothetical protein
VFRSDLAVDWLLACFFGLLHTCGDEVRAGRLDPADALPALNAVVLDLLAPTRPG